MSGNPALHKTRAVARIDLLSAAVISTGLAALLDDGNVEDRYVGFASC